MKILAYRNDDSIDGESVIIRMPNASLVCCAADIDNIILCLLQAKIYALNAVVGDEEKEFDPDI